MHTLVGLFPYLMILATSVPGSVFSIGEEDWESTDPEDGVVMAYDAALQRVEAVLEVSAPLLLVQDDPDEASGYLNNVVTRFGGSPQKVDNLIVAIEAKYGSDPPFKSGWLTANERHVLFEQTKKFLKTVGQDRPSAKAKSILEGMDRTDERRKTFLAADTDKDFQLSITEAQSLFRRSPRVRKRLFLSQGDDELHNVTNIEAAEFSLLRYDQDSDYFVTQSEFLSDDLALRDAITEKLVNKYLPDSVGKWLSLARDPNQVKIYDSDEELNNYQRLKAEEAKKKKAKNQQQVLRDLEMQVSSFYEVLKLPGKKKSAFKTAQRWSDDPKRLHAALLKRYFKDSLNEWWPWLSKGRWFPSKEEREKELEEERQRARYERGGLMGGGPNSGGGSGGPPMGGPGGGAPMGAF